MRMCIVCSELKPLRGYSGKSTKCKACMVIYVRNRTRTFSGRLYAIWHAQCKSSKDRGHPPPAYTLEQLTYFVLAEGYRSVFDNWVASGFDKNLAPSVDRKVSTKPYTLDNIRLVTWAGNNEANWSERKTGNRLTRQNRPVRQRSIAGQEIAAFPSIALAARDNKFCRTNINTAVRTGRAAHGFLWEAI